MLRFIAAVEVPNSEQYTVRHNDESGLPILLWCDTHQWVETWDFPGCYLCNLERKLEKALRTHAALYERHCLVVDQADASERS